jgi:hypothetical protein
MPDIRYVCLSDLHFGATDSLLTNVDQKSGQPDLGRPSGVLERFVECLRHLIERNEVKSPKPTLILNGDILELALALDNQAGMAFERFVELILPEGKPLFERILYIPGNHDHHLWESARETQYLDYISRKKKQPGEPLPPPWHHTKMFLEGDPNQVPACFLNGIVQRHHHLSNMRIVTAYPNFGLQSDDGQKCIVFHHGHFVEPIYHFMSWLRTLLFPLKTRPDTVGEIEAENFAWIDFFWSMMGRSGEAGKDVELVYHRLGDQKALQEMLHTLAETVAKRYIETGLPSDAIETRILRAVFSSLATHISRRERQLTDDPLSPEAAAGLDTYATGPLERQILEELGQLPPDLTLVFGHTHKPFVETRYIEGRARPLKVYNTGGWVVEKVQAQPLVGGAMVLIDEHLDAVCLRMYAESAQASDYAVRLEKALLPGQRPGAFHDRMANLVTPTEAPWRSFSDEVARDIAVRKKSLEQRIQAPNA